MREFAGAGDRRPARGDVATGLLPRFGDARLFAAGSEACDDTALVLDGLKQTPSLLAQGAGQRLEGAGAGGWVRDAPQVRFLGEDELRVAGHAAGEAVGQAEGGGEWQNGDAVRSAQGGGEGRHRHAQHVDPRVALRRHAPGGLRVEANGPGREPAGFFHPGPQPAQGAELGKREEGVRIRRHEEGEEGGGVLRGDARLVERAQIGDTCCERGRKLLRRPGAGLVPGARVDAQEAARESPAAQVGNRAGEPRREVGPGKRQPAGAGEVAHWVEAEVNVEAGGRQPPLRDMLGDDGRDAGTVEGGSLEADAHELEQDARQRGRQRPGIRQRKAEAARCRCARECKHEPARPAFEVGERQPVRLSGVGMVNALQDLPGAGLAAPERWVSLLRLLVQRLDNDAFPAAEDELLLKIRPLQDTLYLGEPGLAGGPGKCGS